MTFERHPELFCFNLKSFTISKAWDYKVEISIESEIKLLRSLVYL